MERIEKIVNYCNGFTANHNLTHQDPGLDLLMEMLVTRQGQCRHQSWCFYALAAYYGIPVRLMSSEEYGRHEWCEFSLDGQYWHTVNLTYTARQQDRIVNYPPEGQRPNHPTTKGIDKIVKEAEQAGDPINKEVRDLLTYNSYSDLEEYAKRELFSAIFHSRHSNSHTRLLATLLKETPQAFFEILRNTYYAHQFAVMLSTYCDKGIPLADIESFMENIEQLTNRFKTFQGKMYWTNWLKDLLKEARSREWRYLLEPGESAFLPLYKVIVEERKWLDPVAAYAFIKQANDQRPSATTDTLVETYTSKLVEHSTPKQKTKTLLTVPNLSGRSPSLEQLLKDQVLKVQYTFEQEGVLDVNQFARRAPMYRDESSVPGNTKAVLVDNAYEAFVNVEPNVWAVMRPCLKHILGQAWHEYSGESTGSYRQLLLMLKELKELELDSKKESKEVHAAVDEMQRTFQEMLLKDDAMTEYHWRESVDRYQQASPRPLNHLKKAVYFAQSSHCPMKDVLSSALADYLYLATKADQGNVQTICSTDEQTTLGLFRPSTAAELWSSLTDYRHFEQPSPHLLKKELGKTDALYLKRSDISNFADEFVQSLDIRRLAHFLMTGE